jgi:hypothetical protein
MANKDFDSRKAALENALSKADIITTKIVRGVLVVVE